MSYERVFKFAESKTLPNVLADLRACFPARTLRTFDADDSALFMLQEDDVNYERDKFAIVAFCTGFCSGARCAISRVREATGVT